MELLDPFLQRQTVDIPGSDRAVQSIGGFVEMEVEIAVALLQACGVAPLRQFAVYELQA